MLWHIIRLVIPLATIIAIVVMVIVLISNPRVEHFVIQLREDTSITVSMIDTPEESEEVDATDN